LAQEPVLAHGVGGAKVTIVGVAVFARSKHMFFLIFVRIGHIIPIYTGNTVATKAKKRVVHAGTAVVRAGARRWSDNLWYWIFNTIVV
jgi:hypothetical protein